MKKIFILVLAFSLLVPSNAHAADNGTPGWDSVMVEAKKAFELAVKYTSDGIGFLLGLLDKDNSSGLKGDGKVSAEVGKDSYNSLVKAAKESYNTSLGSAKKEYERKIKIAKSKDPVDKAMIAAAEDEYRVARKKAKAARDKALDKAKNLVIDVLDKSKDVLDKRS
ncbi:MAG: hypothetical protein ACKOW9_02175 [Candidatus Paceibacterota bacterium]